MSVATKYIVQFLFQFWGRKDDQWFPCFLCEIKFLPQNRGSQRGPLSTLPHPKRQKNKNISLFFIRNKKFFLTLHPHCAVHALMGCEGVGVFFGTASYNALFLVAWTWEIQPFSQEHCRVDVCGVVCFIAPSVCGEAQVASAHFRAYIYQRRERHILFVYWKGFLRT